MTPHPVIATKVCNCLVEDAEANLDHLALGKEVVGLDMPMASLGLILKRFKAYYGGLWVGGSVTLTAETLSFRPNAINRAAHKGDCARSVSRDDVTGVTCEPGFATDIVTVTTTQGRLRFRCYGAKRFAALVERTWAVPHAVVS